MLVKLPIADNDPFRCCLIKKKETIEQSARWFLFFCCESCDFDPAILGFMRGTKIRLSRLDDYSMIYFRQNKILRNLTLVISGLAVATYLG